MLSFDASTEDTVPCRVQYQRRKPTDRIWAIINILTYVAFLSTGFIVVGTSKPRHQILSDSTRGLSEYYMEDAQSCCDTTGYAGYVVSSMRIPFTMVILVTILVVAAVVVISLLQVAVNSTVMREFLMLSLKLLVLLLVYSP